MKRLFWLLCLLLSFGYAPAQAPVSPAPPPPAVGITAPAEAAKPKPKPVAVLDMVKQGGYTIWFLMGLSVLMVALTIFLFLTIRRGAVVSDHF